MKEFKLKRVFIANRGEIARRIALSARTLGIESVCLADVQDPPKYLLESVSRIIPVEHYDSKLFLSVEKMVDYALQSDCDCIHPGYGFLSENAAFAEAVEAAGLTWIGPSPNVILQMGNKAVARSIAEQSGVPCIPGIEQEQEARPLTVDSEACRNFIERCGYPLLIKAALGGGGKGMRVVTSEEDFAEALTSASSEAKGAFGDGSVLIEKYISDARHIEVQIMADRHGNIAVLGDRDCSLQRRHQKILEEAPAPGLSPALREAIHSSALSLAKKVGYVSAGTVEFIVNWAMDSEKTENLEYYFLEMNTRLQVEHPVTEEIFGIDLVSWQFKVAAGEPIPKRVLDCTPRSHSIEAGSMRRPIAELFPCGRCLLLSTCKQLNSMEIGIDSISSVSTKFDPMIAKVVATAETREIAIGLLAQALQKTRLVGIKTNIPFLCYVLEETFFQSEPAITRSVATMLEEFHHYEHPSQSKINDLAEKIRENIFFGSVDSSKTSVDLVTQSAFRKQSSSMPTSFDVYEESIASKRSIPGLKVREALMTSSLPSNEQFFWYTIVEGPNVGLLNLLNHDGARVEIPLQVETSIAHRGGLVEESSNKIVSAFPGRILRVCVAEGDDLSTTFSS